jgi:hypothetical protein
MRILEVSIPDEEAAFLERALRKMIDAAALAGVVSVVDRSWREPAVKPPRSGLPDSMSEEVEILDLDGSIWFGAWDRDEGSWGLTYGVGMLGEEEVVGWRPMAAAPGRAAGVPAREVVS